MNIVLRKDIRMVMLSGTTESCLEQWLAMDAEAEKRTG